MAVCFDTMSIKWPFARDCTSKKVVCDLHSSCILEMETGVMVLRVIFERCFNVAIHMCVLECTMYNAKCCYCMPDDKCFSIAVDGQ